MAQLTDRDLVRLYWPVRLRPAFDALFAIDDAMAAVVARGTEPALTAIKLAWWREQLEKLDTEAPPPEPRLRAAAAELLPRGIRGEELAAIEMGWAGALAKPPDMTAVAARGTLLFELGARLLGAEFDDETIGAAGRIFAGIGAGRRGVMDVVAGPAGSRRIQIPRRARPLTGLAALAARDLRRGGPPLGPEATPGRSWLLMWHWMTGQI